MTIAATVARILLGLTFLAAGIMTLGFIVLNYAPPPQPGLAGQFQTVFFASRWVLLVSSVQVISGVLLLANRYVTLAITMLGAVIANILTYHITLAPSSLPPALVVTVLWAIVASRYRSSFARFFTAQPDAKASTRPVPSRAVRVVAA